MIHTDRYNKFRTTETLISVVVGSSYWKQYTSPRKYIFPPVTPFPFLILTDGMLEFASTLILDS
jgi:hypothetical protein